MMKRLNKLQSQICRLREVFIPNNKFGDRKRGRLMEPFLMGCGSNFKMAAHSLIYSPEGCRIGNNVYIGFNSYLGSGEIELEDEVLIGPYVSITPSNHTADSGSFRFGKPIPEKIVIGKGSWIAGHCCILAGVEIGEGSLVAAGAIVTKSVPPRSIVAGVPARIIGHVSSDQSNFNSKK